LISFHVRRLLFLINGPGMKRGPLCPTFPRKQPEQ
jgi:hypothetical protein